MTVRIAVLGAGVIGTDHARRLSQVLTGSVVTAITDVDLDRARAAADSLGIGSVPANGFLAIEDDDVDAVVVASAAESHAAYVLAAIQAGKPIFCEKPLAATSSECWDVVQAEERTGSRLLQIGFMRRYDEAYLMLKHQLESAEIGRPLMAHMVHRNAQVPDTFTTSMMVTEAAIHEIDIVRWLFEEEIDEVLAVCPRRSSRVPDALQDPLQLLLRTRSGIVVDVEVNVNVSYGYDIRSEIVGETGAIALSRTRGGVDVVGGLSSVPSDWRERFRLAYDAELQQWVNDIDAGQPLSGPTARDAFAASTVADACVEAIDAGTWVSVPAHAAIREPATS